MVQLESDQPLTSAAREADLAVDELVELAAQLVRRHQQLLELGGEEGALDEVEDAYDIGADPLVGRHQHEVSIELSRALVEVARGDAGDIALLGGDVDELGVDLQLLVPNDYVDARVLHLLAPADVGLLVEAGE